jgi:hypothetical protein
MTTVPAEVPAGTRGVIIMSASEVSNRFGATLRYAASGFAVRVDDLRLRQTVGWITAGSPPGVDTSELPAPGHADYFEVEP